MEFVQIKCPGCGADVSTRDEVCEYCGKPVIIRNFTSRASMSMPELNRYVGSYKKEIENNGENDAVNKSIAMCYLKLKQYQMAGKYFQKAMEDNFNDSENYFYAAVCLLEGKKAFLTTRTVIQQMETYLGDAISIENKGVYYYFLAYIKYDYYKRKCFRTTPDYVACIRQAIQCGLSRMDAEQLFEILGVTMPQEISI